MLIVKERKKNTGRNRTKIITRKKQLEYFQRLSSSLFDALLKEKEIKKDFYF